MVMLIRKWLAWTLYGLGHAWCWAFDRDPIGLRGPLYSVYNRLMFASVAVQADGSGPWLPGGDWLEREMSRGG